MEQQKDKGSHIVPLRSPKEKALSLFLEEIQDITKSVPKRRVMHDLEAHTGGIGCFFITPDGTQIVTGGNDGKAVLWDVKTGQRLMGFSGHTERIESVYLHPGVRRLVTGSRDRTAKIWNTETGRCLMTCVHDRPVRMIYLSQNGEYLLSTPYPSLGTSMSREVKKPVEIWNVSTGKCLEREEIHSRLLNGSFGADMGDKDMWEDILNMRHRNFLMIWGAFQGRYLESFEDLYDIKQCIKKNEKRIIEKRIIEFQAHEIHAVTVSDNGKTFVMVGNDPFAYVFNTDTCQLLKVLKGHSKYILAACLSPDGRWLITGSQDGTAKLWDVESGVCVRTYQTLSEPVTSVLLSKNGEWIVTGGYAGTARIWDAGTGKLLSFFNPALPEQPPYHLVRRVHLSKDGTRMIIVDCEDRGCYRVRFWDMNKKRNFKTLGGEFSSIRECCVSEDGKGTVTAAEPDIVKFWDLTTGTDSMNYQGHNGIILSVSLSEDRNYLATATNKGTVRLWDTATGRCIRKWQGFNTPRTVVLRAESVRLAVLTDKDSGKKDIFIFDVKKGNCLCKFTVGYEYTIGKIVCCAIVEGLDLSSDGKWCVTGFNNCAKLFDTKSGRCLMTFSGHSDSVNSLFLSRDGKCLVTGSSDRTARLWDTATGRCLMVFSGHEKPVICVHLSLDGGRLLSGSSDRTARLWDTETGEPLQTYEGHKVEQVFFTCHQQRIVTMDKDGLISFWDTESGKELATFYALSRGFLWMTSPDEVAPNGWFWTDREDLIHVLECDEDGNNPRVLSDDDPRRKEYLSVYNNQKMVINRIQSMEKYKALLQQHLALSAQHALSLEHKWRLKPQIALKNREKQGPSDRK